MTSLPVSTALWCTLPDHVLMLLFFLFVFFPQDRPGGVKDPCSGGKPGEERVHYPGSCKPPVIPGI